MPVPEQAELFHSWAQAAAVKLRLCSCAGCSLLALATVTTCHRACEELFDALEGLDSQASGLREERKATGRALASTLALHIQLFLAIPAQVAVTKARMETAEQCLGEWDSLVQEPLGLLTYVSDDTKAQAMLLSLSFTAESMMCVDNSDKVSRTVCAFHTKLWQQHDVIVNAPNLKVEDLHQIKK
jgi:hypothetical protein